MSDLGGGWQNGKKNVLLIIDKKNKEFTDHKESQLINGVEVTTQLLCPTG